MNLLERIPTRWLLTGAALACLALWAAPSVAQVTPDPVEGQDLFDDTVEASGLPQLTGTCIGCHSPGVSNRRIAIAGSAFADISYSTAMTEFGSAIGRIGGMNQFSQLSEQQIADIAAYIADTPKVTADDLAANNTLALVSTAVGNAVTKNITIRHSLTTTTNFQISSASLAAGTTAFTRSGACNNVTRAQAGTCTFSVTFTPTSTTAETKVLTITGQIGSVPVTRTVTLNGSIAGVVTPPPPAPANDDSGGGALGWMWLSGLALATALLARRRRA